MISSLRAIRSFFVCAVVLMCISLVGCGFGTAASPNPVVIGPLQGIVRGGALPITGGHVILWETNTTSTSTYGSAGTQLATAKTDTNGYFSFSGQTYTCTSTEYAYITVTGGFNQGSSANPNSIQMAAIGSCLNLQTTSEKNSTFIYISELSTVVSAYALSHFTTINANTGAGSGLQLVNVGAPKNNNVATPACTGSGSTLACTAAGLGHAFANAVNLADFVRFDGSTPTGQAYTVTPSNSQGSIPQALINTLANIEEGCVNTAGGKSGDGSACGKLFTATKFSGTAPTDTLQAAINIALNPNTNTSGIYALVPTTTNYFTPTLSAVPPDFSIAIAYSGTTGNNSGGGTTSVSFTYPYSLALDYADNVYILSSNSASASYAAIAGLSANGTPLNYSTTVLAPNTSYQSPVTLATDLLGHFWVTNNSTSINKNGQPALVGYNTADGSAYAVEKLTTAAPPFSIAVDQSNNLWYTSAVTGAQDLFELTQANGYKNVTFASTPTQSVGNGPESIAIDSNQNVWIADNTGAKSGTPGQAAVLPNTGTAAAPAYANAIVNAPLPSTGSSGDVNTYGIAVDSSGNAYTASQSTLTQIVPTTNKNGVITSATATDIASNSTYTPRFIELDGAGTTWASALTTVGSTAYIPAGSSTGIKLHPCNAPAGAAACLTTNSADNRAIQVDSSGSVWEAASGDGHILQIIGTAAPTWPQLSLGKPGVMPQ